MEVYELTVSFTSGEEPETYRIPTSEFKSAEGLQKYAAGALSRGDTLAFRIVDGARVAIPANVVRRIEVTMARVDPTQKSFVENT